MQLHVFEWGDPAAPAVVCLHGITAHGERFRQLAEERWASRFHVLAPDLRGHGRSTWEPPWTFEQQVVDLVDTFADLGPCDWVGHSLGGRILLELAARRPDLVRRAVLLDPAFRLPPQLAGHLADGERAEPVWDSVEACVASRDDAGGMDTGRAAADLRLQLDDLPDGRVRRRTCQAAIVSLYGELASEPPRRPTAPTLLLYAPAYGLVHDEEIAPYEDVVTVPGEHMVMWAAFDETAEAVERFLAA